MYTAEQIRQAGIEGEINSIDVEHLIETLNRMHPDGMEQSFKEALEKEAEKFATELWGDDYTHASKKSIARIHFRKAAEWAYTYLSQASKGQGRESLKDQFRMAIGHALLGYEDNVSPEDWELVFDECVKIALSQASKEAPEGWVHRFNSEKEFLEFLKWRREKDFDASDNNNSIVPCDAPFDSSNSIEQEGGYYYDLFKFFSDEHNLTLVDTEIQDIIHVVNKFQNEKD